ncbi:hypothetical protein CN692_22045 [Bacillus sp. AFS002410]|uniref:hypothetical protein n=1 Tax=Bacillus sp. AFS002410 TaxID=2033481 RepID=UPI000BEFCD6D|nr:hypothetical protein [Bacillus sp. AFS002410]PEJ52239.1 hypothetical protein CN692_22045 [Bacillus sp. AFS002410]
MNKDRVIDIRDVHSVANTYGTNTPVKEDINQDRSVNETDIRFVEKNFLRIGHDAQNNKQPKETLNKKRLTDFLHELGLEPKN